MLFAEAFRREAMPNETLEVRELAVFSFINRTVALRTSDWDLVAWRFACRTIGVCLIFHNVSSVWRLNDVGGLAARKFNKRVSDLLNWQAKIDVHHFESVARHIGRHRLGRVLNNGDAAARLNRIKSSRAIVASATEQHANYVRPVLARSTAKQHIDCRPMPVLSRTPRKHSRMIFARQVAIRRSAVDAAALINLAVFGNHSRKISAVTQDLRQHRFAADMHHHKNRGIQILRQILGEFTKRLYAAGRRPDDNDVAFSHL